MDFSLQDLDLNEAVNSPHEKKFIISEEKISYDGRELAKKVATILKNEIFTPLEKVTILPIPKGGLVTGKILYEYLRKSLRHRMKVELLSTPTKKEFYKVFEHFKKEEQKNHGLILADDLIESGKTLAPLIEQSQKHFQQTLVALLYQKQGVFPEYLRHLDPKSYTVIIESLVPNMWVDLPHELPGIGSNLDVLCEYASLPRPYGSISEEQVHDLLNFIDNDMASKEDRKALHTFLGKQETVSTISKEIISNELLRCYEFFQRKHPRNLAQRVEAALFYISENWNTPTNAFDTKVPPQHDYE